MTAFLPLLINGLQLYGYPALWLSIFLASAGAPLPISLFLLASGAFAALGDLDLGLLVIVTLSAAVAGDNVGYLLGRKFGSKLLIWLKQERRIQLLSPRTIQQSQDYFQRRGGWAVFFSRFLVSALGGTVNLLAGAELYSYWRFLIYDVIGDAIGVAISLGLGYIFGASWETLGSITAWVSTLCIGLFAVIWLLVHLIRTSRLRRRASVLEDIALGGNEPQEIAFKRSNILPP